MRAWWTGLRETPSSVASSCRLSFAPGPVAPQDALPQGFVDLRRSGWSRWSAVAHCPDNMTGPAVCKPEGVALARMRGSAVRLFAGPLRELCGLAGARVLEVDLPAGRNRRRRVACARPRRRAVGAAVAVNKTYVGRDDRARSRRRGGADPAGLGRRVRALGRSRSRVEAAVREVASDEAGAIATFTGATRAHSRGREVVRLEYEAYEGMAEAESWSGIAARCCQERPRR